MIIALCEGGKEEDKRRIDGSGNDGGGGEKTNVAQVCIGGYLIVEQ